MMIKCIVNIESHISDNLLTALTNKIQSHFLETTIIVRRDEKYWKYQDCDVIIYGLSYNKIILVHDIIALFNISWEYSHTNAYNIDTKTVEDFEEAIWSRNVSPEEVFLLPAVEWVHIYTWIE